MRSLPKVFPFFLSLILLSLGLLFFSLPFSTNLYSLFFSHLSFFPFLGLVLIVLGIFLLLALFFSSMSSPLTIEISSYEVSLSLLQESLRRFCEKKYPEKNMEIEIYPQRKQRIEIVIQMKNTQLLDKESLFVQQLKKEIKKYLSAQFDYHRTFFLTLVPSKV